MSAYCDFAARSPHHAAYHDTEYGFPAREETALFERLCLEIMQAGLSWDIVLKRRAGMCAAFDDFAVDIVAEYDAARRETLMEDARIIRNRLKIEAIIANARAIQALRASDGGFAVWLDRHHPQSEADWVKLFKRNFRFTGGQIVREFLLSLGYLPHAHRPDCPAGQAAIAAGAPWARIASASAG